jgi:TldD protein
MDELSARALETALLKGARYADVRLVDTTQESLAVKNGLVTGLNHGESLGFGVRVLVGDAWGFAASARLADSAEVDRVAALAVQPTRVRVKTASEGAAPVPSITAVGEAYTQAWSSSRM